MWLRIPIPRVWMLPVKYSRASPIQRVFRVANHPVFLIRYHRSSRPFPTHPVHPQPSVSLLRSILCLLSRSHCFIVCDQSTFASRAVVSARRHVCRRSRSRMQQDKFFVKFGFNCWQYVRTWYPCVYASTRGSGSEDQKSFGGCAKEGLTR